VDCDRSFATRVAPLLVTLANRATETGSDGTDGGGDREDLLHALTAVSRGSREGARQSLRLEDGTRFQADLFATHHRDRRKFCTTGASIRREEHHKSRFHGEELSRPEEEVRLPGGTC